MKFEIMINVDSKCNWTDLSYNLKQDKDFSMESKKGTITLESCFKAFSAEEMLSGDDQWYCNKCKEHRDIHKKLELYKIPNNLVI